MKKLTTILLAITLTMGGYAAPQRIAKQLSAGNAKHKIEQRLHSSKTPNKPLLTLHYAKTLNKRSHTSPSNKRHKPTTNTTSRSTTWFLTSATHPLSTATTDSGISSLTMVPTKVVSSH